MTPSKEGRGGRQLWSPGCWWTSSSRSIRCSRLTLVRERDQFQELSYDQDVCWCTAAPVWAGRAPSWPSTNCGWTTWSQRRFWSSPLLIVRTLEWPTCLYFPPWWHWGDSGASWSRRRRSTSTSLCASGQMTQEWESLGTDWLPCSFMVSVEEGNYYETAWDQQDASWPGLVFASCNLWLPYSKYYWKYWLILV